MHNIVKKSAIAVALSAVAGSAFAFTDINTADYEIVFSGATASSNTVRNYLVDEICDSTQPIDVFRRISGSGFGNDWGVFCVIDESAGKFQAGTANELTDSCAVAQGGTGCNVAFRKRDSGGSGTGVTPVLQYTDPAFQPNGLTLIQVTVGAGATFNCNTTANPPSAQVSSNGTAFNQYLCGATNDSRFPDAGFSDIEPNKFFDINTPAGFPAYNGAATVPHVARTFGALVFNTPVNTILRDALQAVQFDFNSNCNPAGPNYVPADADTEACMPSLTTEEIRSLFVGGVPNWNNFLVDDGGAKVALPSHPYVVALGHGLSDSIVQVCRRVPGSGTQAQFQVVFLNWPCDGTVLRPVSEPGNPFGGPSVANNSGSSDVGRCLDDYNDLTNNSLKNPIGFGLTRKRYAIGVQSTENNMDLAQSYRYIKVDGFAPTIHQVHQGNYIDWVEQSYQYKTADADLLNANNPAQAADTRTILAFIGANGNTPADTESRNAAFVYPWGQGGWLVEPGTYNPDPALVLSNPVNTATRAPFGRAPNSCQLPVAVRPVQVDR